MNTPTHTPGPWRASSVTTGGPPPFWRIDGELNGDGSAATVVCSLPHYGKDNDANARLIAAAPELLEACRSLLELNVPERCNVRPHEDCGCFSCRSYDAIEACQAALAKATGGAL